MVVGQSGHGCMLRAATASQGVVIMTLISATHREPPRHKGPPITPLWCSAKIVVRIALSNLLYEYFEFSFGSEIV